MVDIACSPGLCRCAISYSGGQAVSRTLTGKTRPSPWRGSTNSSRADLLTLVNRDLPDGSQSDTIRRLERLIEEQAKQLAERDKQLAERDTLIAKLTAEVEALKEELNKNSSNSGKPPSTDTPKEREARQKRKRSSQRKKGAQKGHKGHHRQLLPPEQVDRILDCYPEGCGCGEEPPPDSVKVVRHQVFEIPPITPEVTEYRLHSVTDSNGKTHQAKLPEGVSESPFGPRLGPTGRSGSRRCKPPWRPQVLILQTLILPPIRMQRRAIPQRTAAGRPPRVGMAP